MNTDRDIIEAYRAGELPALTSETLPAIAARQKELNARVADAMAHGCVGGNPWPLHLGAIIAKAPTRERNRAAAVNALVKADKESRRRHVKTR